MRQGGYHSGSQYERHFIEGGVQHANYLGKEDHTIPISRAYMRDPCR